MPIIHSSRVPDYVHAVATSNGDFNAPAVADRFLPMTLAYDTAVDQSLSPYSDEYFEQQLALYREIAGRELDQASGELHPGDLDRLLTTPNPLGLSDVAEVAEHVRSVSTMLSLASLTGEARVLDLGAGQGLSSEVFAYAGCRVHAIDIDGPLGAIARQRADRRHLPIVRQDMNFDDVGKLEGGPFDAAFFFQSFHHCLRPWQLIADLKPLLKEDAVVGFSGEPMQTHWWRHWGLRLDHVSIFAARFFGWFESGWSHAFIADCFARNGMTLDFYTGGHAGGEIGMASASAERRREVAEKAVGLGLKPYDPLAESHAYSTQCGSGTILHGRPAYRQKPGGRGALLFGPYAVAEAGRYEFAVMLTKEGTPGTVVVDVVSVGSGASFFEAQVQAGAREDRLYRGRFELAQPVFDLEVRVAVGDGEGWTASFPTIRRTEGDDE